MGVGVSKKHFSATYFISPDHTIMSLDSFTFTHIADHAINEIWKQTPTNFQREAIPQLLMTHCLPNFPQEFLLVQGAGADESTAAQTVGIVDCSTTLAIEETLALAADQQDKVRSASNLYKPVLVYQLDVIEAQYIIKKVEEKLSSMNKGTNAPIFIYSSPECLMKQPWKSLMIKITNNGMLKLVCVNAVRLLVMFGVTF